ncbi:MAG: hypothetical protein NTY19_35520 [Planctomycetota bacterium]|nr:hypothetical protein [Planctomycetota bacterium]
MSEYQYYEFRTVDRSLTAGEIAELEKLSSRAEVTATSFTNTYSYGDFRGDPDRLMERYFDVFVYVANWGTRHFMVRLPVRGVDLPTVEAYAGGGLSFWIKGEFVILSFLYEDEGGGEWEAGEEYMPGLISLREELLNGDVRSLYLGWLSGIYFRPSRRTSTSWRSRDLPTCATLRHEIGRSSSSRPACLTSSGGTPRSPLFSNDSGRPV